jgi:hypothetical protein
VPAYTENEVESAVNPIVEPSPPYEVVPMSTGFQAIATGAADRFVAGVPEQLLHQDSILFMTAEVFPGSTIDVGTSIDPEFESQAYPVVTVHVTGSDDWVARGTLWHRRMRAIIGPGSEPYRLDLHVA